MLNYVSKVRTSARAGKQFVAMGAINSINTFDPDAQDAVTASAKGSVKLITACRRTNREAIFQFSTSLPV